MGLRKDVKHSSYEEQLRELEKFSQRKEDSEGVVIALYNYLKGECSEVDISLFYRVTSVRTSKNSFKLCQGHLDWLLGSTLLLKGLSSIGTVWVESPSLEVFKTHRHGT
ncbi:hypothetical protein HGM15179_000810 [Zosterops borbonicus]|uniref:Uncharacterized protein n=1 Tax=Zosterops borbonicus TaxID=364589 RepID=A0A8K1GXY8_9PASS|nr:hypothetical protein HGM15179_000810 [Zosterops borbonicus]